jgi:hypothetical protein
VSEEEKIKGYEENLPDVTTRNGSQMLRMLLSGNGDVVRD